MYKLEKDGKIYSFNQCAEDKDKYVVFACAKNENKYIREWVAHNLAIGFDKVIIADNNDDDSLEKILDDYIAKKQVEIFNCHGIKEFQCQLYDMFFHEGNYKWCAYIDCDEFIEVVRKKYNIKELLNEVDEDVLCLHWMTYTSNGLVRETKGDVQKRFTTPKSPVVLCKENMFIKCIIRGGKKEGYFNASHFPVTNSLQYNIGGYCKTGDIMEQVWYPVKYKRAYIKHYYTKSYEEYIEKVKRGWPDGNQYDYLSDTTHFFALDKNNSLSPEEYAYNIFSSKKEYEETRDFVLNEASKYKIIVFKNYTHPYRQMFMVPLVMSLLHDKIFLIYENNVDDTLFNSFLEMSLKTSNKLYTIIDDDDCVDVLKKENEEYYYKIN